MRHNGCEDFSIRLALRNASDDSADLAGHVRLLGQYIDVAFPVGCVNQALSRCCKGE